MSEPVTVDEQASVAQPAVRLPPAPPRLIPKALQASPFAWIPFGGGIRRCAGAAFAKMEMNVVLRTVLRHFTIETTSAPGEKRRNGGGLGFTPKDGGRIIVHRRHL